MNLASDRLRRGFRGALWISALASTLAFSSGAGAQKPHKAPAAAPAPPPLPPSASSSSAAAAADSAPSSPDPAPSAAPSSSDGWDILMPSAPAAKTASPALSDSASPAPEPPPTADPDGTAAPAAKTAFVPPRHPPFVLDPSLAKMTDDNTHSPQEAPRSFSPMMQVGFHAFFWPYLLSAVTGGVALEGHPKGDWQHTPWLLLPGMGPFITLAFIGDHADSAARGTLIADGASQSLGLAILILSAAFRKPAPSSVTTAKAGPTVQLGAGPGAGLGLSGRF